MIKRLLIISFILCANATYSQQFAYYKVNKWTTPFVVAPAGLLINQIVFCVDSNKFFRLLQTGSNGMSLSNTKNIPIYANVSGLSALQDRTFIYLTNGF